MRGAAAATIGLICGLVACTNLVGYDELTRVRGARPLSADGGTFDGAPGGAAVSDILLGPKHTCAVLSDRTLKCWGLNDFGQLGVGGTDPRLSPTTVPGVTNVAFISLGERHTCVTTEDGSTLCWGSNQSGQLGIGAPDSSPHDRPMRVEASPAKKVQAGKAHTCIETKTKSVECWGANQNGQLGDGTTTPKSLPTRVPGLSGVAKLSTGGGDHSCAVAAGDAGADLVYCWGLNDKGQIGQPLTTPSSTLPISVPGLLGADKVFVGREHSCAPLSDTTVWCWGSNDRGQLGDGTFDTRHTAAQVRGVIGMSEVGMGYAQSCGVSNGVGKCWGSNEFGQLGIGAAGGNRPVPERVVGDGWKAISTKGDHACGMRDDAAYCWGRNDSGQLGLGTTQDVAAPTRVVF